MRSSSYYIKSAIIAILLFAESLILLDLIYHTVVIEGMFTISLPLVLETILIMLALIYTLSLSLGAWGKWEQYVLIISPVVVAVFIKLFTAQSKYVGITVLATGIFLAYEIYKSTQLKELLIKEKPQIIMRFSARGLLLVFSILAGMIGIIDPSAKKDYNFGESIAELAGKPVQAFIDRQVQSQILDKQYDLIEDGSQQIPEGFQPPAGVEIPQNFSINLSDIYSKPTSDEIEIIIQNVVNSYVNKYQAFLQPILSIVAFGTLQAYAIIAYFLYGITIRIIFWLAKKTKLFKVEYESVEKEILKF